MDTPPKPAEKMHVDHHDDNHDHDGDSFNDNSLELSFQRARERARRVTVRRTMGPAAADQPAKGDAPHQPPQDDTFSSLFSFHNRHMSARVQDVAHMRELVLASRPPPPAQRKRSFLEDLRQKQQEQRMANKHEEVAEEKHDEQSDAPSSPSSSSTPSSLSASPPTSSASSRRSTSSSQPAADEQITSDERQQEQQQASLLHSEEARRAAEQLLVEQELSLISASRAAQADLLRLQHEGPLQADSLPTTPPHISPPRSPIPQSPIRSTKSSSGVTSPSPNSPLRARPASAAATAIASPSHKRRTSAASSIKVFGFGSSSKRSYVLSPTDNQFVHSSRHSSRSLSSCRKRVLSLPKAGLLSPALASASTPLLHTAGFQPTLKIKKTPVDERFSANTKRRAVINNSMKNSDGTKVKIITFHEVSADDTVEKKQKKKKKKKRSKDTSFSHSHSTPHLRTPSPSRRTRASSSSSPSPSRARGFSPSPSQSPTRISGPAAIAQHRLNIINAWVPIQAFSPPSKEKSNEQKVYDANSAELKAWRKIHQHSALLHSSSSPALSSSAAHTSSAPAQSTSRGAGAPRTSANDTQAVLLSSIIDSIQDINPILHMGIKPRTDYASQLKQKRQGNRFARV